MRTIAKDIVIVLPENNRESSSFSLAFLKIFSLISNSLSKPSGTGFKLSPF